MEKITLFTTKHENKRIFLGLSYIDHALIQAGYEVERRILPEKPEDYRSIQGQKVYAGSIKESPFIEWLTKEELLVYHQKKPEGEGFYLESCPGGLTVISGGSDAGTLYGCLELAERIEANSGLPKNLAYFDAPVFKLRGPAVGLQKTKLEPPRLTYEYPVTPNRFPWFYDKTLWQKFMDMMLKQRCNVLYIWSGHPFSSFVKVADYPEALEVTEEEYNKNRALFRWLTEECDRRGIWVVMKFYSIHIPLPFAEKHNLELLQSNINPLVADYTEKSIVEFIKDFPHVGLMVCLGEALRGTQNKTDWFIKHIIPAVKTGIKEAGLLEEPPLILRGHDCDPYAAMQEAMKIYKNLYTMWKYNGEGLTTYFPKGNWMKIHQSLSGLGTTHILNVHILANLEPFQFNAPGFIQKCIQAGQNRLGGNGLHLYPLFFWDWPYTPDKSTPRLLQIERDWIWYQAWFRYAWKPDREEKSEREYWLSILAAHFRCGRGAVSCLLDAMESAAQCAPQILGRVGITEGNRQTLSLGMTMSQLTNVTRYRPNKELWNSVARKGEQPEEYVRKELNGEPHIGETPVDMIRDIRYLIRHSLEQFYMSGKFMAHSPEIQRIGSDLNAIALMSRFYCFKIEAALKIIEYKLTMNQDCSGNTRLLEDAAPLMEESLNDYKRLTALTEETYLYANSMQTPQRKIPFPDGDAYGHWRQCLPEYEKELENFKKHVEELKHGILPGTKIKEFSAVPLKPAAFLLESENCEVFRLSKGAQVFRDCDWKIQNLAKELEGLQGIRFGLGEAIEKGMSVKFTLTEDCQVLIGYMDAKGVEWLQVPDLETNTHADDRGGLAVVYANAVKAEGCPPVHIHAFQYEKGTHTLYFGTGAYLIAGIIKKSEHMIPRNAGLAGEGLDTLDWLYEA